MRAAVRRRQPVPWSSRLPTINFFTVTTKRLGIVRARAPACGLLCLLLVGALPITAQPGSGAPFRVRKEWHRSVYGLKIGSRGMFAADLDRDGREEIVTSGEWFSTMFWYVVSYARSPAGGEYRQEFVSSPFIDDPIRAIRLADVDGDSWLEILVALDHRVLVYDGATRKLKQEISIPAVQVRGFAVADVDSDGGQELVFCNALSTWVQDLSAPGKTAEYAGFGCFDLAVGQVDSDPDLEIVIGGSGYDSWVLDGRDGTVEWTSPSPNTFGTYVRLADVDHDGMEEIVAGTLRGVAVYDADRQELVWVVAAPQYHYVRAVRVFDLDGDGDLELLYGYEGGFTQSLYVLDAATGAEIGSFPSPTIGGFGDIAAAELDGDPGLEVIFSFGNWVSSRFDALAVFDAATEAMEWVSPTLEGRFQSIAYGDVDFDGRPEILYLPYVGPYHTWSPYFVHEARSKRLEYQSEEGTMYGERVAVGDVDSDPQLEIFVGRGHAYYHGDLTCYDGLDNEEQWSVTGYARTFSSLALDDYDGDGNLEVAATVFRGPLGPPTNGVAVFDGATGALEWQSPELSLVGNLDLLRSAEVDGDPNPELIVAGRGGAVAVLSPDEGTVDSESNDLHVLALDTPDLDGDLHSEIVVGTREGDILRLDPATGDVVETLHSFSSQLDALVMRELTGDWIADAVVSIGGRIAIYDGRTWELLWSSEPLNEPGIPGSADSLLVADVDKDGRVEILVNAGNYGIVEFEVVVPRAGGRFR
jgi:hypothetical protein